MQKIGQYTKNTIPFFQYQCENFTPITVGQGYCVSCGDYIAYLLTGKRFKFQNDTTVSDKKMLNFLRKHGIKVIPLSICNVTNHQSVCNEIRLKHVVLISQLMFKGEGSWSILYNGNRYHGREIGPVPCLEFINRPIISAYVLFKDEWKMKSEIAAIKPVYPTAPLVITATTSNGKWIINN